MQDHTGADASAFAFCRNPSSRCEIVAPAEELSPVHPPEPRRSRRSRAVYLSPSALARIDPLVLAKSDPVLKHDLKSIESELCRQLGVPESKADVRPVLRRAAKCWRLIIWFGHENPTKEGRTYEGKDTANP